jgi:hypothetical protein
MSMTRIFNPNNAARSHLNDDIYDRWHLNRVNESFIDSATTEDDDELPKSSDAGYFYWIGKDYANSYAEDFKDVHEHAKDQLDRSQIPRMPWRDQACMLLGSSARDLARHFIQRWNQCKV